MSLNIAIFYGSVRSARQGIKAAFTLRTCQQRGHRAPLIDPVDYPLPLIDKIWPRASRNAVAYHSSSSKKRTMRLWVWASRGVPSSSKASCTSAMEKVDGMLEMPISASMERSWTDARTPPK